MKKGKYPVKQYAKEYRAWLSMKKRINPTTNHDKERYGKLNYSNLSICDSWINNFTKFMDDIGKAPSSKHELDRKDNLKGYYPDNVKWATHLENVNNRSNTRNITAFGKTQTMTEWAEETGISYDDIYARLLRGMPVVRALTQPMRSI